MKPVQEIIYDYATRFVGLPYRWGGDDAVDGFDCSGLSIEILQAAGVFPHGRDLSAAGLFEFFAQFPTALPDFGALAFFGAGSPTHVGFCLNPALMLEAGGGGSKTLTKADAAAQNAFIRIRPIRTRKDLIGFSFPPYPWKGF